MTESLTPHSSSLTPLKLDLGAGPTSPPGFTPLGHRFGSGIFPLPYADESVDEIRASHVLEHFSHRLAPSVPEVLTEWARVLKKGGRLRIAVPDFARAAQNYLDGVNQPTEGYVMGGHVDEADIHKSLFDETKLKRALAAAGLVLIRPWASDLADCAALPISLNLEGIKPHQPEFAVVACKSVPRLAFGTHARCAFEALPPLNVTLLEYEGAYWEQCFERCIENALKLKPDAICGLDYDSAFIRRDMATLMQLMMCHPEADAIAPMQAGRGKLGPLFSLEAGDPRRQMSHPREAFAGDLAPVPTAHFGLTLLRADKLAALPKPWFWGQPAPDGSWNEGRHDADIVFWHKWREAGNTLFLAPRVVIGHLELCVRWPDGDLKPIHQPIDEYRSSGKPKEAWQ